MTSTRSDTFTAAVYNPISVLLVLLLPEMLRFGQPFWTSDRPAEAPLVSLGYVGALALSTIGRGTIGRLAAGLSGIAALGAMAFVTSVFAPDVPLSRSVVSMQLGLGALLLLGRELPGTAARSLVVVVLAVAGLAAGLMQSRSDDDSAPTIRTVLTTYYPLDIRSHGRIPQAGQVLPGGALAAAGPHVLVMTGRGVFYRLDVDGDGTIRWTSLPVRAPVDFDTFDPFLTDPSNRDPVRMTDVIARATGEGWQLFVTHPAWDAQHACVNLAISTLTLSQDLGTAVTDWTTLAMMQPCLSIERVEPGGGFWASGGGGRLAWQTPTTLLVTVGDYGFDGLGRPLPVSQLDDYDYGKTHLVDVDTGRIRRFTKGNRNAQGLYIDPQGTIWSTEHGPRGGDELNLLSEGANYGWPFQTFGTAYELLSWPPADTAPPDPAIVGPRFAWLPSIGISNLLGVETDRFPRWRGNLLVTSLADQAIHRVGLDGTSVQLVERIPIGVRIRDIIERPDGDLWLWSDQGDVLTVRPGQDARRGASAMVACTGCHALTTGGAGRIGPNLAGVTGRAIAGDPAYPGYSVALRQAGGRWTAERLQTFLADPAAFAPGTTMSYRVTTDEDRRAIVAYLQDLAD